jgi:acetyl esterase/lipase
MFFMVLLSACTVEEKNPDIDSPPESGVRGETGEASCTATRSQSLVYRDVDGVSLMGTLSLPAGDGPFPAVVLVPGGGFFEADYENPGMTSWTQHLLDNNIAVFAITYQVVTNRSPVPLYPGPVIDVTCAAHLIYNISQKNCISPDQIFLMGESAGGHLVTLAGLGAGAVDDCATEATGPIPVAGVIDYYGPANWTTLAGDRERGGSGIVGLIQPEQHYTGSDCLDPADPLCIQASAFTWVSGDHPPFFIAHSKADQVIPVAQSLDLEPALQAAGPAPTLRTVDTLPHGWWAAFSAPEGAAVRDEVLLWMRSSSR